MQITNDGWGYRIIGQSDLKTSPDWVSNKLVQYRGNLEMEQLFKIGGTEYLFVCRFSGGSSRFGDYAADDASRGFGIQIYNYTNHKRVKTFTIRQSDSGDDWMLPLDDGSDYPNHYLNRAGEHKLTFFGEDSECDYILEGTYNINSQAIRKTNKKKEYVLDKDGYYVYNAINVSGQSKIAIGTRKCLYAVKYIGGEKIDFYVLDWNLDGVFSEDDVVYCSYHQSFFNFGETIRLTNSDKETQDNKYMFKLIKPTAESDNYILQLQLVDVGVRKDRGALLNWLDL